MLTSPASGAARRGMAGRDLPAAERFLRRIMRPDDANIAGNVHGGTVLKMIEEAGAIISTRHCNSGQGVSGAGGVRRVRPFLRSVLRGQLCLAVPLRFETRREAWRCRQGRKAVAPRGALRLPALSCSAAGWGHAAVQPPCCCALNSRCWKAFCFLCLPIREDPAALGAQRVLSHGSQGSLGCGGSVPSSSSFSSSARCRVLPLSLHPDLVVLCPQEPCVAALARVERTDFLSPMCIGEVANVSAEITYTSKHSVEVQVNVMSENILTGKWFTGGQGAAAAACQDGSLDTRGLHSLPASLLLGPSMPCRGTQDTVGTLQQLPGDTQSFLCHLLG